MPNTNGHGPNKRAILYARVSTDEQARSGYSLAQQLEALREYAAQEGYEVLVEVTDPGQSGASLERPGMDQVRDLEAGGGVSVVLAQDRDRFSREPACTYLLRREFEEQGCTLKSLNDRGDDSPEGELMDGVFDQFAKFERAKHSERSRRGKEELRERLGGLEETRRTAQSELEFISLHQKRLEELERDADDLVRHYAALVPESLEVIPPEERHRIYKTLRMRVLVNIEGTVTVEIVSGKAPEPDASSVKSGGLCS